MKVLISNDGYHAHYFERIGWANAFNASGIECYIYDCKQTPAFAIFDTYEPDIFIGQLYNLDRATIKCIQARPHLKVALRAGEWWNEDIKKMNNPHILSVTTQELITLGILQKSTGKPDFIYSHYTQEDIENTHRLFMEKLGISVIGIPMSADVHTYYNGTPQDDLMCDIGFVGGYWPYKAQVFDKYLLPMLYDFNYSAKIFGNQIWPNTNQYCGMIEDSRVKDLFVSAKICPNLSEPHAQTLGMDVNERAFKVLSSGGFCIMDNVNSAKKIFKDGIVFADSPEDFVELIGYYLTVPEQRAKIAARGQSIVMNAHTNYHRASLILKSLKETQASNQVLNAYIDSFQ